jgi:hypothetical protein
MTFCLNPLNAELNPICHLLALLGAHHILHVSRIRIKVKSIIIIIIIIIIVYAWNASLRALSLAVLCVGCRKPEKTTAF